jgi:hypothetical protein
LGAKQLVCETQNKNKIANRVPMADAAGAGHVIVIRSAICKCACARLRQAISIYYKALLYKGHSKKTRWTLTWLVGSSEAKKDAIKTNREKIGFGFFVDCFVKSFRQDLLQNFFRSGF